MISRESLLLMLEVLGKVNINVSVLTLMNLSHDENAAKMYNLIKEINEALNGDIGDTS